MTAVLTTTVGMMNREPVFRQFRESLFQRSDATDGLQAIAAVVANDFARVQIHDQGQIHEITLKPQVGNITDPDLVRSRRREVSDQVPEDRQTVPGVGGPRRLRQRFYQQPVFPKHTEERVASDGYGDIVFTSRHTPLTPADWPRPRKGP